MFFRRIVSQCNSRDPSANRAMSPRDNDGFRVPSAVPKSGTWTNNQVSILVLSLTISAHLLHVLIVLLVFFKLNITKLEILSIPQVLLCL